MKYIISQSELPDLKAKMQKWLATIYNHKYYRKTKKRVFAYVNLCNYFYMQKITLANLVNKYFKGATKTFYRWSDKIMTAYYSNNFDFLIFRTTRPINPNYLYNSQCRQKICDLYYGYQNIQAGGMYSLFNNLKMGFHNVEISQIPKNIKTFYRWIKSDPRWEEIKLQVKKTKRHFKKYEVSELGLLQMDAKIITKGNFPVDKRYYVYDFIDEKTRMVVGYVYDSLGTENAISSAKRAIKHFGDFGITVKRIRTDNGVEFINSFSYSLRKINTVKVKVKERPFTIFLNDNKIIHETTPIRSPQSNGKIERFHQHYNKLFYFKYQKLTQNELQHYLNDYYYFYNFERCHSSLKNKTPFQVLQTFLRTHKVLLGGKRFE